MLKEMKLNFGLFKFPIDFFRNFQWQLVAKFIYFIKKNWRKNVYFSLSSSSTSLLLSLTCSHSLQPFSFRNNTLWFLFISHPLIFLHTQPHCIDMIFFSCAEKRETKQTKEKIGSLYSIFVSRQRAKDMNNE